MNQRNKKPDYSKVVVWRKLPRPKTVKQTRDVKDEQVKTLHGQQKEIKEEIKAE